MLGKRTHDLHLAGVSMTSLLLMSLQNHFGSEATVTHISIEKLNDFPTYNPSGFC